MTANAAPSHAPRTRSRERIGADKARAWARELRLKNPFGKAILMAVANYMNEDGAAWPGISTIASDTDIAEDTVASRLRWLESIGAIVMFKSWVDENGRRNTEGRGRPTSFEIRFLFDADQDAIEVAAVASAKPRPLRGAALASHEGREVSPRPDGGLTDSQDSSISDRPLRGQTDDGPGLAPDQPPTVAARREESKKKEDSPPTPPTGGDQDLVFEKQLERFIGSYPIPITDLPKTQALLQALTEQEREDAILGAKGYADYLRSEERRGHKRAAKDAHRWLRDRQWMGYIAAGKVAVKTAERRDVREGSSQFVAWTIFHQICGRPGIPEFLLSGAIGERIASVPSEWPPVGPGLNPDIRTWIPAIEHSGEFAAWLRRLRELDNVNIAIRNISTEGKDVRGLLVPCQWPPSKSSATGTP